MLISEVPPRSYGRIHVGVVGAGGRAAEYTRAVMSDPVVVLNCVVEARGRLRARLEAELPALRGLGWWKIGGRICRVQMAGILEAPRVLGAIVVQDLDVRADLARALLRAGKHVLCDTPIATTVARARALRAEAAARGLALLPAASPRVCARSAEISAALHADNDNPGAFDLVIRRTGTAETPQLDLLAADLALCEAALGPLALTAHVVRPPVLELGVAGPGGRAEIVHHGGTGPAREALELWRGGRVIHRSERATPSAVELIAAHARGPVAAGVLTDWHRFRAALERPALRQDEDAWARELALVAVLEAASAQLAEGIA